MDKKQLSERDICSKFITPAVTAAGWDALLQIREEVSFTKGQIIVRGKLVTRGKGKRVDYILYYKPNIPLALIEVKDNTTASGTACSRRSNMPRRWTSRSSFPRTVTALSSMTAPGPVPRKRPILPSRRFRHRVEQRGN